MSGSPTKGAGAKRSRRDGGDVALPAASTDSEYRRARLPPRPRYELILANDY